MINEVAPPGFGHTKGDKKKGVEKGGTAAAFYKARKEGRFKGSKSDMFAIMSVSYTHLTLPTKA